MEYACASVVVYDKKNNGTLVHVHRVLVACSQKNRDFLFLVTQRLGKKKNFCVFKLSTVRECDNSIKYSKVEVDNRSGATKYR